MQRLSKLTPQIRKFATTPPGGLIPSSGTYPKGFQASGVAAGVKKKAGVKDVALVTSSQPCTASGVFTTNAFQAAPVLVDKEILQRDGENVFGVLTNAGCANACTGEKGLEDAWKMSRWTTELAEKDGLKGSTCVMSTGVIGQPLPMEIIRRGIKDAYAQLSPSHNSWLDAATAIMTTDTFPKLRSKEFRLPSGISYRFAGMCKGAGMIHPNMATMLSTVYTDVGIDKKLLDNAVKYAADWSFNAISVDGDMSTNDTFMVLANGASGAKISSGSKDYEAFRENLKEFSEELAQLIVRDGEGATKFVTIHVKGAPSFEEAKKVAATIATSNLVKTALFGQDANWGRIVCAVGYSGVNVDPSKVNLHFSSPLDSTSLHIFKNGAPYNVDEDVASRILKQQDINITVDLGLGNADAKMYTCDFSHEYVSINADYRS